MLKKKNKDLEGDKQKLADELINLKVFIFFKNIYNNHSILKNLIKKNR